MQCSLDRFTNVPFDPDFTLRDQKTPPSIYYKYLVFRERCRAVVSVQPYCFWGGMNPVS